MSRISLEINDLVPAMQLFDGHSKFALFLGAGASVESGVPSASWIVSDLLRRSYSVHYGTYRAATASNEKILGWGSQLPWYQSNSNESEYAMVMRNILVTPGAQEGYCNAPRSFVCP